MRAVILLLCALPGAASAECPTRAALSGGVPAYVTYPDESVVELKWIGEGMIRETTRYPDGIGDFRMLSMGGVLIVDEVDMEGDRELYRTRVETRYPTGTFARMPIAPFETLDLYAVNHFADGTDPEDEHVDLQAGGLAEIDIAGCRYEGFPMLIRYNWGEELFTSMMTHIPELGVSLEIARMDAGMPPVPFAPQRFDLTPP